MLINTKIMRKNLSLNSIEQKKFPEIYYFEEMIISVREKIRTPDLLIRSQTLYPAELRAHCIKYVICTVLDRVYTSVVENASTFFNLFQSKYPGIPIFQETGAQIIFYLHKLLIPRNPYSNFLYNAVISSILVSFGLPGRHASS